MKKLGIITLVITSISVFILYFISMADRHDSAFASLQGNWQGSELGELGQVKLEVNGNTFIFHDARAGMMTKSKFSIDSDKEPAQMDFTVLDCEVKDYIGYKGLAIIQLDGDNLELAIGDPASGIRPKNFEPVPGVRIFHVKKQIAPIVKTTENLDFSEDTRDLDLDEKTIDSIKINGNLYTVRYYGDYHERMKAFEGYFKEKATEKAGNTACSMLYCKNECENLLLGRNFDALENAILARFDPPDGYSSYAMSPASDVRFKEFVLCEAPTEQVKEIFLTALPCCPVDGINETGLAIAIAGTGPEKIKISQEKRSIFVLQFIRMALDTCSNIEQVAELARNLRLFDQDINTISHHFIVADANGNSMVIDYPDGKLRFSINKNRAIIRTNHFLDSNKCVPENTTSFSRYNIISNAITRSEMPETSETIMNILQKAKDNTAWSAVYDLKHKKLLLSVNENYETLFSVSFLK